MYFADYHTHSRVSPDAFSSMTERSEEHTSELQSR